MKPLNQAYRILAAQLYSLLRFWGFVLFLLDQAEYIKVKTNYRNSM